MSPSERKFYQNYFVKPLVISITGVIIASLCSSRNLQPALTISIIGFVFAVWDFYFRYKQKGIMGWVGKHEPPIAPQILAPTWYYASNLFAIGLFWVIHVLLGP